MSSIYKAVNFVKFEKNLDITFFSRDLTKPNFKVKDWSWRTNEILTKKKSKLFT